MMMPQDKFTKRFKRVMQIAREEADRLQHDYIGTEHLLLGIIQEREDLAAVILLNLGVDLDKLRKSIEEATPASSGALTVGQIPFTPRAKQVLEIAAHEANSMKSKQVETEHLLLALIRDKRGIASQILATYEITYEKVKEEVRNNQREGDWSERKKEADQSRPSSSDQGMPDERMQILKMLADGKITAEEADQLLRAVEESPSDESFSKASTRPKWLRIRITEGGSEKVKLNIPLVLAKMGLAFLRNTAMLQIRAKGIDLERLLQADITEPCTLIEVEEGANKVEVYVE